MKIYLSRLVLLTLMAFTFTAKAEVEVPDELRFIFWEAHLMTPNERTAWQRKLQETPNLGGRLSDLLWEYYREGNDDGIGATIGSLMSRDDISPEQLKKITDEMRRLAGMSLRDVQKMGVQNMLYRVRILERYPSPENEDLALVLLNSEDSVIRSNAATTLGKIGTERSIEPMRKHYDQFRHIKTDPAHAGAPVFEAEKMLLDRVAKKTSTASTPVPGPSRQKSPQANTSSQESKLSYPSSLSSIIVLSMVAAIGLLWVVLKRRIK